MDSNSYVFFISMILLLLEIFIFISPMQWQIELFNVLICLIINRK